VQAADEISKPQTIAVTENILLMMKLTLIARQSAGESRRATFSINSFPERRSLALAQTALGTATTRPY
jgi:hypothetical protein